MLTLIDPCLISESSCIRDELTIRNNLGWGENSQKEIPARETCLKKILRIVISKKKILEEEA